MRFLLRQKKLLNKRGATVYIIYERCCPYGRQSKTRREERRIAMRNFRISGVILGIVLIGMMGFMGCDNGASPNVGNGGENGNQGG